MIVLIAPHTVAPGQMEAADRMARITGESARAAPGFIGRLVMQQADNPHAVWSLACWANRAAFENWLKIRTLPWTTDDLHRVYEQGALVQDAEMFALTGHQGNYFNVDPPAGAVLGGSVASLPYSVVAPHIIDPTPESMCLAAEMIYEVGESARRAPGFLGRMVLQSNRASNRIWSVSSWASRKDFENWVPARKFWWTLDDVKRVFPQGALVEDAKQMYVLAHQ